MKDLKIKENDASEENRVTDSRAIGQRFLHSLVICQKVRVKAGLKECQARLMKMKMTSR